ncbi:MAG TPA: hypothetical protein VFL53_10415 [Pseudolabrys sp.]|nr:hypothetical protein [Pseudolabrys sp.]
MPLKLASAIVGVETVNHQAKRVADVVQFALTGALRYPPAIPRVSNKKSASNRQLISFV